MEHFFAGIFATAFYAVMDIQTGVIHFTNAGHPAPYALKRSKGTVERMADEKKRSEPAIGLFLDFEYTTFEYAMHDNDILFFFTDGIFEIQNDTNQLFGEKRLLAFVKERLNAAPEEMLDAILNEITLFSGTHEFADDACMVTMHVKKASGSQ
jgi:sigma-B regulation protein RsbU (phosphoserine phosphatase)